MPRLRTPQFARLSMVAVLALATVPFGGGVASAATIPSFYCSSLSWDRATNVTATGCDLQSGTPIVDDPAYISNVASEFLCHIGSLTDNGGGLYDVTGYSCKKIHP